jgi:hypothetical protein
MGTTCLLLAEVVDVHTLSVHDACTHYPLEANACDLRKLSASWRKNLVTCIEVKNVRLAPEFVFLAKGNQGFLHQFSHKKGNQQFCAKEDVGKTVSVLLGTIGSDGKFLSVQRTLEESFASIGPTDNASCACGSRRNDTETTKESTFPADSADGDAANRAITKLSLGLTPGTATPMQPLDSTSSMPMIVDLSAPSPEKVMTIHHLIFTAFRLYFVCTTHCLSLSPFPLRIAAICIIV